MDRLWLSKEVVRRRNLFMNRIYKRQYKIKWNRKLMKIRKND